MYSIKRHFYFLGLIVAYIGIVVLFGLNFVLLTSKWKGGLGLDLFCLSAWSACYWQGPHQGGTFDPYPHRSVAILLGAMGMLGIVLLKFLSESK